MFFLKFNVKLNLQIFHYYWRKQYKNIENSRITEQNLVFSLPFSLSTTVCASHRLPQRQNFETSQVIIRAVCTLVIWLIMVFSKLRQLDITACIKKLFAITSILVFHIFSCYKTSVQIFLFYKFFYSHRGCSIKKLFWKNLWYSKENTCVGVSFMKAFRPRTVLKKGL